jgi:hypothetical protein
MTPQHLTVTLKNRFRNFGYKIKVRLRVALLSVCALHRDYLLPYDISILPHKILHFSLYIRSYSALLCSLATKP